MIRFLIICILCACGACAARAQSLEWVLEQVEANNASLDARRKLTDAQQVEARMGNSLEDPQVEYVHNWGNPSELGRSGELSLVQEFDFPTLYASRNKLSKLRREQYGYEYDAYRQQVLLEAQSLYIEIAALKEQGDLLRQTMEDSERIAQMFARSVETGDANVLEENKARFELAAARKAYGRNRIELSTAENRMANLNGGVAIEFGEEMIYDTGGSLPALETMAARYELGSPELIGILCEAEVAQQDLKVSRGGSLPKISLGYKFEHASGKERFNGVIVGLSIPIFANRHNVSRAKAQVIYAAAEAEKTRLDLRSSLEQMYAEAELLEATLAEYSDISDRTDAASLLAKALDAGHISVADYYAELRSVTENRLDMVELRRDLALVRARIMMVEL